MVAVAKSFPDEEAFVGSVAASRWMLAW